MAQTQLIHVFLKTNWLSSSGKLILKFTFTFMHLGDAFIQSDFFYQYVCSQGIEPTTFCAAKAMLYHWATGTYVEMMSFCTSLLRIFVYSTWRNPDQPRVTWWCWSGSAGAQRYFCTSSWCRTHWCAWSTELRLSEYKRSGDPDLHRDRKIVRKEILLQASASCWGKRSLTLKDILKLVLLQGCSHHFLYGTDVLIQLHHQGVEVHAGCISHDGVVALFCQRDQIMETVDPDGAETTGTEWQLPVETDKNFPEAWDMTCFNSHRISPQNE